ncbi:MAG: DUF2380 domain-containing protein [Pseudomonadota bacterium]
MRANQYRRRFSRGGQIGRLLTVAFALSLATLPAFGDDCIAVLHFGLDDDTLLPGVDAEKRRVDKLAPFLRQRLSELGHIAPPIATPQDVPPLIANGYLIHHPARAAAIGQQAGCRWAAIGKLRKFSFMESWLRLYLIDVAAEKVVGHAEAEIRGHMSDHRMTRRTTDSLAEQLDEFLAALAK